MGNTPQSNESARDKAVSLATGASDSRVAVLVIDRERRKAIFASIELHQPNVKRLTRRRRAVAIPMAMVIAERCQKQSTPVAVAPVPTAEAEPKIDVTPLTFEATTEQLIALERPLPLYLFPSL